MAFGKGLYEQVAISHERAWNMSFSGDKFRNVGLESDFGREVYSPAQFHGCGITSVVFSPMTANDAAPATSSSTPL